MNKTVHIYKDTLWGSQEKKQGYHIVKLFDDEKYIYFVAGEYIV